MKRCPYCGTEVPDSTKFCTECGASLSAVSPVKENYPAAQPPYQNVPVSGQEPQPVNAPVKTAKRQSALGIVAFVLSLTIILSVVGFILAIIDLCVNKNKKRGLTIAALVIGGIVTFLFVIGILFGNSSGGSSTSSPTVTTQVQTKDEKKAEEKKVKTEEEKMQEFIASCEEVVYRDVERDPDAYKGRNIRIEGKVIQVHESLGTTTLRVSTASSGFYDDIWLVTYKPASGEKRILEDDRVVIYGVCQGVETYTAVLGNKITLPSLKASYVEVAELYEPEYTVKILRFDIGKEKYGNNYEYYAIVEIRNTGESNLYIKDKSFDIEDSSGHLISTEDFSVNSCPNVIKPGESGYLYTSYAIDLEGVTNTTGLVLVPNVAVKSVYDTPVEYGVSDVSVTNGSYGVKTVGRVTNNTSEDESYLYVTVVYYGRDGQVLGIAGTSVTGLEAGKTGSFEISGMMMEGSFTADDVASYTVFAQENYYSFD